MGIDYSAAVIVGLPFEDIEEKILDMIGENEEYQDMDFYDVVYELGLDRVSPYFDASNDACIYGFIIHSTHHYCYEEIKLDESYQEQIQEFEELFGLTPKVYLSPYGT